MTVLRKELRAGRVSLLVWSAVVGGLMAVCVGMYPSFAGSMEDVSALFAGMGDFSAAFGLDKLAFGSIMGFYGTECGNILGLGGAFFAALTAMGLLAGEEGGHTAEFLLTHPVDRGRVAMEGTPREIFSRVEELQKLRLDVPQVTLLAHELQQRGILLPQGILTTEELVTALKSCEWPHGKSETGGVQADEEAQYGIDH